MPTLRLLAPAKGAVGHGDEVLCCAYSPDSRFVVSGGWDGHLRIWEAATGAVAGKFQASKKPVSACAVSPDGTYLVTGSSDGMLARWDAASHQEVSNFLAHTRPISAMAYSSDGLMLVTASWDRTLIVWGQVQEQRRPLNGHNDIVAGCQLTPDGRTVMSWSHDNTVRLWDTARGRSLATLTGHNDRVLAGGISPDGRWGATGARDGDLIFWDLVTRNEKRSLKRGAEVRLCLFLLDNQTLLAGDGHGRLVLLSVPDLKQQWELDTELTIICAALAPAGNQLALGCNDGMVRLVAVDGAESAPLSVTVVPSVRRSASTLQRLFGKSTETPTYLVTCPACRAPFEVPGVDPSLPVVCPGCRRQLRITCVLPMTP